MSERPTSMDRRRFLRRGALGGLAVLVTPGRFPLAPGPRAACGVVTDEVSHILRDYGGEFGPPPSERKA